MGSHHFFLFVSAIIFLSLPLNFPSKAEATFELSGHPNKLLIKVCKQSGDFGFCMKLMKSKPRILSAKNISTVANFALAVTRKRSLVARNFFNRIANAAQNPATGKVLEECATYFNETVGMLNLSGLEGGTATLDVHYALDNVQFCENALGGPKVGSRAISDAIDDWKKYFFVAYATVEIIEDETPSGP